MKQVLFGFFATTVLLLAACTYVYERGGTTYTLTEYPDGRKEVIIKEGDTSETIRVDGMSRREIKRRIPGPWLDADELCTNQTPAPTPTPIEYRYEYRFDVYDTTNTYVNSIAIETFADLVAMIPVVFQMGGLTVPSQEDLDELSNQIAIWWIDPETDWHTFN